MHEDQNTALDQLGMTVQSTPVMIYTLLTHSVYFFLEKKEKHIVALKMSAPTSQQIVICWFMTVKMHN